MKKTLALVQTGGFPAEVAKRLGSTSDYLVPKLSRPDIDVVLHDGTNGHLPDGYDAVVIEGNFSQGASLAPPGQGLSLGSEALQLRQMAPSLRRYAERGIPILGICMGHQLLVDSFGGRVEKSPNGLELATVAIEREDDALFDGLEKRFYAHAIHTDHVLDVDKIPGGRVIASNAHTAAQAVAIGDNVRSVQFHPELDEERMRILAGSSEPLQFFETPQATRILWNFVSHFVESSEQ